jgi:hypothetical protein
MTFFFTENMHTVRYAVISFGFFIFFLILVLIIAGGQILYPSGDTQTVQVFNAIQTDGMYRNNSESIAEDNKPVVTEDKITADIESTKVSMPVPVTPKKVLIAKKIVLPKKQIIRKVSNVSVVTEVKNSVEKSESANNVPKPVVRMGGSISLNTIPSSKQSIIDPGYGGGGAGGGGGGGGVPVIIPVISPVILPIPQPVVISPLDYSVQIGTTTITFNGTAPTSSSVANDFSSSVVSVGEDGGWVQSFVFPIGTTTIRFWTMKDSRISSQRAVTIGVTPAPAVGSISLDISACTGSIVDGACLVTAGDIVLSWVTSGSPASGFRMYKNNVPIDVTSSPLALSLTRGTYIFEVRSLNESGSVLATSSKQITVEPFPVVISEVAWAGTASGSNNQWIELANNTGESISLEGWVISTLIPGTLALPVDIPLHGQISPYGRYILERGSDNVLTDISADLVYGTGEGESILDLNGEKLKLLRLATLMDETAFGEGGRFPAGDKDSLLTMERFDQLSNGDDSSNWGSALPYFRNGVALDGSRIAGSPRMKNTVTHLINRNKDIAGNFTLTAVNNPYVIPDRMLEVLASGHLKIEPGVIIKSKDWYGLNISGSVEAVGLGDAPIYFTTLTDDSLGGDTDEDAGATSPSDTRWQGISLNDTAGNSTFSNVTFAYMSQALVLNGPKNITLSSVLVASSTGGIACYSCELMIADSSFRNIDGTGLYIAGSALSTMRSLSFLGHGMRNADDYYFGPALSVENSTVVINDTTISGFGWEYSLLTTSATATIQNITIKSDGTMMGARFNNKSFITLKNADISGAYSALSANDGSDITVKDSVFKASANDSIGLFFDSLSRGTISNCTVDGYLVAGISVRKSGVTITDSIIKNNNYGIELMNPPLLVTIPVKRFFLAQLFENLFATKIASALEWPDDSSYVSITNSAIYNNIVFGIRNNTQIVSNAVSNWWGDATGPYHASTNAGGLGNPVTDYVNYGSYLNSNPRE